MSEIGQKVEDSLLTNITKEFEDLLNQCDHKDKEISGYKDYVTILETEISKL